MVDIAEGEMLLAQDQRCRCATALEMKERLGVKLPGPTRQQHACASGCRRGRSTPESCL